MKLSIVVFNYINYLKKTFNYSKKELNSLRLPRPLFIWLVEIIYCKINLNRLLIMLLWCKVTFIFISAYWIVSLTQYCCLIKPRMFSCYIHYECWIGYSVWTHFVSRSVCSRKVFYCVLNFSFLLSMKILFILVVIIDYNP